MKIYLLDRKKNVTDCWTSYFGENKDVEIVCSDFGDFMDTNKVECVVSPANSYGLMDGGYDLAISDWFGFDLMKKVQSYIVNKYFGEQPVGTSFIIDTEVGDIKLIHTPTMRVPSAIVDPMVVYHCMRSTLILARRNDIKSIVIPAFGGSCGSVPANDVAYLMFMAYSQIFDPPCKLGWDYAERWRSDWEKY